MERDRNLLFGIFAVQLRLLRSEQLIEAAGAWAANPATDLPDRLVASGALAEVDRQLLDRLVAQAVSSHEGDVSATLERFGGANQVAATYAGTVRLVFPPAARSTVASVGCTRLEEEQIPGVLETPGRYTRESEHARGGMGRVLLVHDEHLGRDIALKELLPVNTAGCDAEGQGESPLRLSVAMVARFLQEARITGQLEHPSIVPVYELGRRCDGSIYYTMKLVRGRTLSWAIRKAGTVEDRIKLLSHFVDLCQAVAYAHSRGVVHRDLKPTNVMVGEFGETVVLDWGIAKVRGHADAHADGLAHSLRAMSLGEEAARVETVFGHALGTPAYMAPEQAEGELTQIDERSDVYSLGAVLYEILTGEPPYAGDSVPEILQQVCQSAPVPIRERVRGVPEEIAAICSKAMDRNRGGRYADAKALADDVQHYLGGGLVNAFHYGLSGHLRRFAHRHAVAVILGLSAALLAVVLGGAVFQIVENAQRVSEQARDEIAASEAASEVIGSVQRLLEESSSQGWGQFLEQGVPELRRAIVIQPFDSGEAVLNPTAFLVRARIEEVLVHSKRFRVLDNSEVPRQSGIQPEDANLTIRKAVLPELEAVGSVHRASGSYQISILVREPGNPARVFAGPYSIEIPALTDDVTFAAQLAAGALALRVCSDFAPAVGLVRSVEADHLLVDFRGASRSPRADSRAQILIEENPFVDESTGEVLLPTSFVVRPGNWTVEESAPVARVKPAAEEPAELTGITPGMFVLIQ